MDPTVPHAPPDVSLPSTRDQSRSEDTGSSIGSAGARLLALAADADPTGPPGYDLLGELARGGMGVVYRAYDRRLDREVAVKVVQDKYRHDGGMTGRFVEEAKITGRLQHPGVPPVHDLGELPGGGPYLAMKLIAGRTLAEQLKARPDPAHDRGRFVAIFQSVCQTVGYAHSRGVIHRDLKPANVMVGDFGEVQVMDWGLAKELASRERERPEVAAPAPPPPGSPGDDPDVTTDHHDPGTDDRTRAGVGMGTPAYMPPEQANGEWEKVDGRADVFALGSILCAVLTGQPAYTGTNSAEVFRKAESADLADAHARLDGCGADAELVGLCRRCLGVDPADRPADGSAVAAEVGAYTAGVEAKLRQAERDTAAAEARAAEQRRKRRWQLAAAGAVGVVVFGLGGFVWWEDKQRTDRRAADDRAAAEQQRLDGERVRQELAARRQREIRAERARAAVGEAAALLPVLYERGLWDQAVTRLGEAAALVGADGDPALLAEVDARGQEARLLAQLDQVRRGSHLPGPYSTAAGINAGYAAAFVAHGIDVRDAPSLAARVRASPARRVWLEAIDGYYVEAADPAVRWALRAATAEAAGQPWRLALPDLQSEAASTGRFAGLVPAGELTAALAAALAPRLGPAGDRLIERLLIDRPNDFWLHAELATNQTRSATVRTAAARAALACRPDSGEMFLALGMALDLPGGEDAAAQAIERAYALRPDAPWVVNAMAVTCLGRGRQDDSIGYFREAVRLAPTQEPLRRNLAGVLRMVGHDRGVNGDLSGAESLWREAASLGPSLGPGRDQVVGMLEEGGFNLLRRQDYYEAERYFRLASGYDPKRFAVLVNLAVARVSVGDYPAAVEAYERALAVQPGHPVPTADLARLLALGPDGVRNGRRAVELASPLCDRTDRPDPMHVAVLAAAWAEVGEFERAIACQERAMKSAKYRLSNRPPAEPALAAFRRRQPFREAYIVYAPPPREAKR